MENYITQLSSLSKIQYANIISLLIFSVVLVVEVYQSGFDWMRIVNIANFALAWYMFINIRKVQSTINKFTAAVEDAEQGKLSKRLEDVNDGGELDKFYRDLNSLFNQLESFANEVSKSIRGASSKSEYRIIDCTKFNGQFNDNVLMTNEAISHMQEDTSAIASSAVNARMSSIGDGVTGELNLLQNDLNHSLENIAKIVDSSAKTLDSVSRGQEGLEDIHGNLDNLVQNIDQSVHSIETLNPNYAIAKP
jgi:methyl-accepting chemotaxis protein